MADHTAEVGPTTADALQPCNPLVVACPEETTTRLFFHLTDGEFVLLLLPLLQLLLLRLLILAFAMAEAGLKERLFSVTSRLIHVGPIVAIVAAWWQKHAYITCVV